MGRLKRHYHDELEKMAHEEHRLSDESIKTIRKVLEEKLAGVLSTYIAKETDKLKDISYDIDADKIKEVIALLDSLEKAIDDINML